ncbi:MAG: hypothetical protein E7410_06320 [Ruminococcaceae bacterium]|nr:hypothetical protein [Oscillospiraceae bacterium]
MKLKKVSALVCAVVLCIVSLVGCGIDTREVFSVNGEKVTGEEYAFFLGTMKEMIAQESSLDLTDENSWHTVEIDNKKAIDVAKEKAFDDAVSLMVQVQKAKEEGIVLDENDKTTLRKQKQSIISMYGGESVFEEQLKKWQVSPDTFDKIMQNYMYASKLQAKYIAEDEKINAISEEDILAKYDSLKEEMIRESIFVKHILVMTKDAENDEQAKERAQAVLARLTAGEDFDTVMREVSDDSESSYEGYSFTHNDGQMDADFDNASYALSVGEMSGLVKTRFGYHIIKRLESNPEIEPLEDVRDGVISAIKSERYQTMLMGELVSGAAVVKQEQIYNSIK